MPIEIKELIIKANVENKGNQTPADPSEMKNKIIESCVEQVLQILENKKER